MNDLPIETTAGHVPTVEQQQRIAAAARATETVKAGGTEIDEETAKLIALPLDQRNDPEKILRAAFATKMRNSRIGALRAAGVALDPNGKEVSQ